MNSPIMTLSNSQYAAAKWPFTSTTAIKACAGAGKTTTLVQILGAVARNAPPTHKIYCLTFTRKAAELVQQRVHDSGVEITDRMFFGTFHSLYTRTPNPLPVASEDLAADLKAIAISRFPKEKFPTQLEIAAWCAGKGIENRVWSAYLAELALAGVIDHDGCLRVIWTQSHNLFDGATVIVDEFQDSGPAEAASYANADRLIAIGDERQVLYGFRGAVPGLMRKLSETRSLDVSYRCPVSVCNFANKIFPEDAPMVSGKGHVGVIGKYPVDAMMGAFSMSNAILCRSNRDADAIRNMCIAAGYNVATERNFWTSPEVKRLEAWLEAVTSKSDASIIRFLGLAGHDTDAVIKTAGDHLTDVSSLWIDRLLLAERYDICGHPTTTWDDEAVAFIAWAITPDRTNNDRIRALLEIRDAARPSWSEGIVVTTIHKAKGLEWDNVALYWPTYTGKNDEEKCMLYVAATRAISTFRIIDTGQPWPG